MRSAPLHEPERSEHVARSGAASTGIGLGGRVSFSGIRRAAGRSGERAPLGGRTASSAPEEHPAAPSSSANPSVARVTSRTDRPRAAKFPYALAVTRALACLCLLTACDATAPALEGSAGTQDSAALAPPPSASSSHGPAAALPPPRTPNEFFARGTPTFVLGTRGDDEADRAILGQVELVHESFFQAAKVIPDTSVDAARGPSAWPPNPVLYGGAHVSSLLAAIEPQLPFKVQAGLIEIGLDKITDPAVIISVVPARAADERGPGYPTFLLYAGNGTPGIAEINAFQHGGDALYVGDAFGLFIRGDWIPGADGRVSPRFVQSQEREQLEHATPVVETLKGKRSATPIEIFSIRPARTVDQVAVRAAVMRGLNKAVSKLAIDDPRTFRVFVYPNRKIKELLSGQGGDGHAMAAARALHVISADPEVDGPLERLVAHEGTHILAHDAWGPALMGLTGEGLAVWVAGTYQGITLEEWRKKLRPRPLQDLIGASFRKVPEPQSYPQAGLFMAAAIREVGLQKTREHLYSAAPRDLEAACVRAGTTLAKLEEKSR